MPVPAILLVALLLAPALGAATAAPDLALAAGLAEPAPPSGPSPEELRRWLRDEVAYYLKQCAPVVGCDIPEVVDEHGDIMTGQLEMQSDILLTNGSRIVAEDGSFFDTPPDTPLQLKVNETPGIEIVQLNASEEHDGGTASVLIKMFGDVSVNEHGILFLDNRSLRSPSPGVLTFDGQTVCTGPACGGGGVSQVNTGAGLAGGPITTTGTISVASLGITNAMLASGAVSVDKLAFDPATQAELDALAAPGTINLGANPVHWTKLKGVPAGFADGVDHDTTYTAGTGLALSGTQFSVNTAAIQARVTGACASTHYIHAINADGTVLCDPDDTGGSVSQVSTGPGLTGGPITTTGTISVADLGITGGMLAAGAVTGPKVAPGSIGAGHLAFDPATQTELDALATPGTLNAAGNPVDWTKLKGVPAGFADGVDHDTTYTAGTGLALSGTQFSVNTAAIQARVTGACASTHYIHAINADGTVLCDPDDTGGSVSSVGSGLGLVGGPITSSGTLSIDTAVVPQLGAANTFTGLQTVLTGIPGGKGVVVRGAAGQSANLLEFQDGAGGVLATVGAGGGFTGSGAGLTNLNAAALASGTVPSSRVAGAYPSITGVGTLSSGTWNGATIQAGFGGTGAPGLTGVVVGNGVSPMTGVAGTAAQLLRRNAANTAYEFVAPSGGGDPVGALRTIGTDLTLTGGGDLSASRTLGLNLANSNTWSAQQSFAAGLRTMSQEGLRLEPFASQTGELRFRELTGNGANHVGFKAPSTIAADRVWTLPAADGSAGQALTTDGAGLLSWGALGDVTDVNVAAGSGLLATTPSGPVVTLNTDFNVLQRRVITTCPARTYMYAIQSAGNASCAGDADFLDGLDSTSVLRSDASDTYTSGTLTFDPVTTLHVNGVLSIGHNSAADDDTIRFDAGGSSLLWRDAQDRFEFSDNLLIGSTNVFGDGRLLATTGSASWFQAASGGSMFFFADVDNTGTNNVQWVFNEQPTSSPPTNPVMRLEETGNLYIDGTYNAGGADLAESYLAEEPLRPGDLVALSPAQPGAVRRTAAAYDRMTLGVVSTAPGVLLGNDIAPSLAQADAQWPGIAARFAAQRPALLAQAASAHPDLAQRGDVPGMERAALQAFLALETAPVALSGRVPVKVDASFGAIQPGDLLAASPVPGVAMKATRAGPVIGTALEGLAAGQGTVLLFVNQGWFAPEDRITQLEQQIAELRAMVEGMRAR